MQSTPENPLGLWIGENPDQSMVLLIHNSGRKPVYDVWIKWKTGPKGRDTANFRQIGVFLGKDVQLLPLGTRADFLRINGGRARLKGVVSYHREGEAGKICQRFQCKLPQREAKSSPVATLQQSHAA